MARFLIWTGKSAIPNPNALAGDVKLIDSIHLDGGASGSGTLRRLLRPRTISRPPTVAPMTRPTAETALPVSADALKKGSPTTPIAAQVTK